MDKQLITRLHTSFEQIAAHDEGEGVEYWYARDLQMLLGYREWRNFLLVIDKAREACRKAGQMVVLGSGAKRKVDDIALTRYAELMNKRVQSPVIPV